MKDIERNLSNICASYMQLFGKERLAFLVIEKLKLAKQIFHLREEKGEKNWSENKGKYWERESRGLSGSCGGARTQACTQRIFRVRACVRARGRLLHVFTATRVAEGAARSVAVSPYRFLCNYN